MCPWCYIGKRRLEKALAMVPDMAVDIRWRPYQLDHTIPESGMDRQEYLRNKFGSDEQAAQVYGPVRAAGKDEEIPFEFDKIEVLAKYAERTSHHSLGHGRRRAGRCGRAAVPAVFHRRCQPDRQAGAGRRGR